MQKCWERVVLFFSAFLSSLLSTFILFIVFLLFYPPIMFLSPFLPFVSLTFLGHFYYFFPFLVDFYMSVTSLFPSFLFILWFCALLSYPPLSTSPFITFLYNLFFLLFYSCSLSPPTLPPTVPECFADHVFIRDTVVGQGLAPDGVERVVQGLGSKFIGLKDKQRHLFLNRTEHQLWLITAGSSSSSSSGSECSFLRCQFHWNAVRII